MYKYHFNHDEKTEEPLHFVMWVLGIVCNQFVSADGVTGAGETDWPIQGITLNSIQRNIICLMRKKNNGFQH